MRPNRQTPLIESRPNRQTPFTESNKPAHRVRDWL